MSETDYLALSQNAVLRRCWLLSKVLEHFPLDRALDLARAAEGFVTGSDAQQPGSDAGVPSEARRCTRAQAAEDVPGGRDQAGAPTAPARKRAGLALSPSQREGILNELARGAANAELASQFGLSRQQVQGLRIGAAREIARRKQQNAAGDVTEGGSVLPASQQKMTSKIPASVEDIVRYLRQQDDVVVRQANGNYLVNGRFELPFTELVARANGMRARQNKPAFHTHNSSIREVSPVANDEEILHEELIS